MPVITLGGKYYDMPEVGGVKPSLNSGHTMIQPKGAPAPIEVEAEVEDVIQLITLAASMPGRTA